MHVRVLIAILLTSVVARNALAQSATIEITPSGRAAAGSTVTVKWSGPNGRGDYITVARKGSDPSAYSDYKLTSNGRTPVNPVALVLPAEPGAYEIRYVAGDSRRVLATLAYEVTAIAGTVEGPVSVAPGARFEVAWSGPNNRGDFVTIVAVGADPRAYGSYVDARLGQADAKTGRRAASLLAPTKPGRYELRYVQQASRVIGTRVIEVTASASASVPAASTPSAPGAVLSGTGTPRAVSFDRTADLETTVVASDMVAGAVTSWPQNGTARYVVTVTNRGAIAANGATLAVPRSTGLSKTVTTCTATNGAQCPAGLTAAALENGVSLSSLPPNGSVTVAFFARVQSQVGTSVTATSTVTAPAGVPDANSANNTSSQSQTIVASASVLGEVQLETYLQTDPASTAWWQPNATARYRATIAAHGTPAMAGDGAVLAVPATENLSKTTVSCAATNGAQCPGAVTVAQLESGVVIPTLPFGSTVTFTFAGSVTGPLGGTIAVSSFIVPPQGKFIPSWMKSTTATQTQSILVPSSSGGPTVGGGDLLTTCTRPGPVLSTPVVRPYGIRFSWAHFNGATYTVSRNGVPVSASPIAPSVYPFTVDFAESVPLSSSTTYIYTVVANFASGCGRSELTVVPPRPFVPVASATIAGRFGNEWEVNVGWAIPSDYSESLTDALSSMTRSTGMLLFGPGFPTEGFNSSGCAQNSCLWSVEWGLRTVRVPAGEHTWIVAPYWETQAGRMVDVNLGARVTLRVP